MGKPPIFMFSWFNNFELELENLSKLAMKEDWDYKKTPTNRLPILNNYIHHTFNKIQQEDKIVKLPDHCVFNTGLVTENQEEIFALFQKNKKTSSLEWFFLGWKKNSERDLLKFPKLPEGANYFSNPEELIYDLRIELRPNIDHIISDNKSRFPDGLKEMEDHLLSILLKGTIDDALKRVRRNYKTAIPQFYKGKLQLLLPLCLLSKSKADLALVVDREIGIYRASTVLTLDMAINNARLIAKPDDEWLKP